jgi:hypothetical protein
MPLDMPPNINVSTLVRHKTELVSGFSSTLLKNLFYEKDNTLDAVSFLNYSTSTKFNSKTNDILNHSTWIELSEENLDIISKINFNKTFRVKSKIKSISKYSPKIVID